MLRLPRSRRLPLLAGAALAVAVGLGSASPASAAEILPLDSYSIVGQSIQAMEPLNGGTANGTPIVYGSQVDGFNNVAVQQRRWILALPNSNGTYSFMHSSGRCLDIEGASTAASARLILWDCHFGPNQQFRLSHPDPVRPRAFRITAAHSSRALGLGPVGSTVRQNGTAPAASFFFPANDSVCFLCGIV